MNEETLGKLNQAIGLLQEVLAAVTQAPPDTGGDGDRDGAEQN